MIYVVEKGDTLYNIGRKYNVDYKKIVYDNNLNINDTLVIGQTLIISKNTHKKISLEINGYIFPNININYLKTIISYFTYISIFSYQVNEKGDIYDINDENIIRALKENDVLPIMVVTNIGSEGRFSSDLAHIILNNEIIADNLIMNIIDVMKYKGYNIINIDFEYVYPDDKEKYIEFLIKLRSELKKYNYKLFVSVAPKYNATKKGTLYEAHDYYEIGKISDRVIIMTYEWGYSGGPPMAVAPLNQVKRVLEYAVSVIDSNKILMGIPNYGYDWTLPFIKGTIAKSISNTEAIDIARKYRQSIYFDKISSSPFFYYYDNNKNRHEVWFEDARSIKAKIDLANEYNLAGISYWTINRIFPQNYLIIKSNIDIPKYII